VIAHHEIGRPDRPAVAWLREDKRIIGAGADAETAFRAGGEKPFLLYRSRGSEDRRIRFLAVEEPRPDQAADGSSTRTLCQAKQELPPVRYTFIFYVINLPFPFALRLTSYVLRVVHSAIRIPQSAIVYYAL
jgi:hypothetical protein